MGGAIRGRRREPEGGPSADLGDGILSIQWEEGLVKNKGDGKVLEGAWGRASAERRQKVGGESFHRSQEEVGTIRRFDRSSKRSCPVIDWGRPQQGVRGVDAKVCGERGLPRS